MGSFMGHVLPGTLFLLVGAWHVWSAAARYVTDPRGFRVRAWSPVGDGKLRHLELYVVAGGAFSDMCVELLYSTHLKFFVDGGVLNPSHMNDFEHGAMLLMFFLFGVAAILSEKTSYLPLPEGTLCLIAAAAFSAEYLLFYFHSTTHQGLEGYYHLLLVVLIGLCVASAVAGAIFPESLAVDLASGASVALQGLWFYQTAMTLYGPAMPRGCLLDGNDVRCGGEDEEVRGEVIANLQLSVLVFGVLVFVLACYAVAAARYGHPELRSIHADDLREGDGVAGGDGGIEIAGN